MADDLNEILGLLEWSDKIVVFAGAGMSKEIGIPTYWTGSSAKYAGEQSEYGFTELEHASASMWENHFERQSMFSYDKNKKIQEIIDANIQGSVYTKLLNYLVSDNTDFFVVTSNVDSAFQASGFPEDKIHEIHGAVRNAQCLLEPAEHKVFKNDIKVFNTPCPTCGGPSRPNTLLFDDVAYNPEVADLQAANYRRFRSNLTTESIILEIGVGVTIPRIREAANKIHYKWNTPYIHINPAKEELNSVWNLMSEAPTAKEFWVQENATEAFKKLNIS